jgi:hypothetical protein
LWWKFELPRSGSEVWIFLPSLLQNFDSLLNPSLDRLIGLYFEFPLLWHYLVVVVVVKKGDELRRSRKIMVELAILVEPPGTP